MSKTKSLFDTQATMFSRMEEPFLPEIENETNTPRGRRRRSHQFVFNYLDGRTSAFHDAADGGSPRSSRQFTAGYFNRGPPRGLSPLRPFLNNTSNNTNSNDTSNNEGILTRIASLRSNSIARRKQMERQSTVRPLLNDDDVVGGRSGGPVTASPLDRDRIVNFDRSSSAPPLFTEEKGLFIRESLDPHKNHLPKITPRILHLALLGLLLYVIVGVTVFTLTHDTFEGERTVKIVDALYFTVVTLSTIGYGDITPASPFTKLFTCFFILVGFGFIDILLDGLVTYVLDVQEEVLLDDNKFNKLIRDYVIDKKKGRMRIRSKVCLALAVVFVCLTIGTLTVHFLEELTWVDSFYLSVTSVTTVGYGDHTFKTPGGRCFAVIWLLASTLAVAKAFLYLTEYRLEKRNRRMAKDVLHKKLTIGDLVAADMDHDGSISKAEYVIFKLKEMGKITDSDVEEICMEFDNLEYTYNRKITITDLIGGNRDSRSENEHDETSPGET